MKRTVTLVFVVLFLAFLFAMPIITLFGPQEDQSFYEQRNLAPIPALTKEGIWSGNYFSQIETTLNDHIALRERFLTLNTALNLAVSRPVVNDLVVNSEVLLDFYGHSTWDIGYLTDLADRVGQQYQSLHETVQSYGGYFCYLGLPLQSTYFASQYPSYLDSRLWHTSATRTVFTEAMTQYNIPFIDMHSVFDSMNHPLDFYLKTDHHFTYQGAFAAYTTLMKQIQEDTDLPVPLLQQDAFHWQSLPNPFLGSANRKLYGLWPSDDTLEFATLKTPIPFRRMDNGTEVSETVFLLPAEEHSYVNYSLYMGGDIGETIIQTNRPNLPNVLIYGDSFTNPIETLLWTSFNETRSLDFRYYTKASLQDYIDRYRPDVVVCVRDESVYLVSEGNGTTG